MLLCLYSLLAVIEYIPYHIYALTDGLGWSVAHLAISGVFDFLLPPMLATVLLVRWCDTNTRRTLLECLIISLSRILYYTPHFYLYFFSMGLDTGDAIPFAVLIGLLYSIGFALYSMLLFLVGRLVHLKKAKAKTAVQIKESLRDMLSEGASFDFSMAGVGILFSISLVSFIVNLPFVDTMSLVVNYGDSIRMDEIFAVILDVLFRLALMLACQLLTTKFAAALTKPES